MSEASQQLGGNIAATLSLQEHAKGGATPQSAAGGFLADIEQSTHMGKNASGVFSLEVFNLQGIGDLFIPKGVLSEDIGTTLGNISKRASSPIVIGAEEAALRGANVAAHSTEIQSIGANISLTTAGISSSAQKPVSVQY
jgi:hypothetical protein